MNLVLLSAVSLSISVWAFACAAVCHSVVKTLRREIASLNQGGGKA